MQIKNVLQNLAENREKQKPGGSGSPIGPARLYNTFRYGNNKFSALIFEPAPGFHDIIFVAVKDHCKAVPEQFPVFFILKAFVDQLCGQIA
jgi:hypothetical protein